MLRQTDHNQMRCEVEVTTTPYGSLRFAYIVLNKFLVLPYLSLFIGNQAFFTSLDPAAQAIAPPNPIASQPPPLKVPVLLLK